MRRNNLFLIVVTAIVTSIVTSLFLPLQKKIEANYLLDQLNLANLSSNWQTRAEVIKRFRSSAQGLDDCLQMPLELIPTAKTDQYKYCYNNYFIPLSEELEIVDAEYGGKFKNEANDIRKLARSYLSSAFTNSSNQEETRQEFLTKSSQLKDLLGDNFDMPYKKYPTKQ